MGESREVVQVYNPAVRKIRRKGLPWADAATAMDLNGVRLVVAAYDLYGTNNRPGAQYELQEKGYGYARSYGAPSDDQALLFIRLVWPMFRPQVRSEEGAYAYVMNGFAKLDPRTKMAFLAGVEIRYTTIDDVEG